jgi:hypothetical protein
MASFCFFDSHVERLSAIHMGLYCLIQLMLYRLLSKPRIWFSKQEKICEQLGINLVNEGFEQIFDESSEAKVMVLKEGYCIYSSW